MNLEIFLCDFFIFRLSLNLSYRTWDLRLPWPEGPLPAASFWSVNTAEVLPPSTTIYWGHSLVSNCIGAFKIFFWSMASKLDITRLKWTKRGCLYSYFPFSLSVMFSFFFYKIHAVSMNLLLLNHKWFVELIFKWALSEVTCLSMWGSFLCYIKWLVLPCTCGRVFCVTSRMLI